MDELISEEDIIGWNDTQGRGLIENLKGGGDVSRLDVGFVCDQYLFNYILQEEKFVWKPDNKYMYINGEKEGDPNDTATKINLVTGYVEHVYYKYRIKAESGLRFVTNIMYKLLHNETITRSDFPETSDYNSEFIREKIMKFIKIKVDTGKYNNMSIDELERVFDKEQSIKNFEDLDVNIFEIIPTLFDKSFIIDTFSDSLGIKNIRIFDIPLPSIINILKEQFTKDMFLGGTFITKKGYLILIMYDDVCETTRRQMVNDNKPSKEYLYAIVNSFTCTKERPQSCVTESEFFNILESIDLEDEVAINLFFAYPEYEDKSYTPYQSVAYKRMIAAVLEKAGTGSKQDEVPPPPKKNEVPPPKKNNVPPPPTKDETPPPKKNEVPPPKDEVPLKKEQSKPNTQFNDIEAAILAETTPTPDDYKKVPVKIEDAGGLGDCLYYSIYDALLNQQLLKNVNTLINFQDKESFMIDLRRKVSENADEPLRVLYTSLCPVFTSDTESYNTQLLYFPDWLQKLCRKFIDKNCNTNDEAIKSFIQLSKENISLKGQWAGQLEFSIIKELLKSVGIYLDVKIDPQTSLYYMNNRIVLQNEGGIHYKYYIYSKN